MQREGPVPTLRCSSQDLSVMTSSSSPALYDLDATALVQGYRQGTFSPVDVLEAVLARTAQLNPSLNMFFHIAADSAREQAQASAERWRNNAPLSALDGVPISIKDSVAMQGTPMQVGSIAYKTTIASADSPPVARLRAAGAVLFAKTTMPDHGMFGAGVSTAFGVTRNPWNPAFNTGGSSSGAGAALAARLGPLSIGSDIAGSVRFPAGLCGLASLKPTHGLVPHLPVVSVRDAGPMARTARDLTLALDILSAPDLRDFGSVPAAAARAPQWSDLQGLRIGLMLDMGYGDRPDPEVERATRAAAAVLSAAGADVQEMGPLLDFDPMPALTKLYALPMLARFEAMTQAQREQSYPPLREFAETARPLTALQYLEANNTVDAAKAAVHSATTAFDYVIAPVLSSINWAAEKNSPHEGDIYRLTSFCAMFNQTGQPVGCVCAGFDARGLPIGIQLIGRRFDDRGVLQLAQKYEALRGFDVSWPECA